MRFLLFVFFLSSESQMESAPAEDSGQLTDASTRLMHSIIANGICSYNIDVVTEIFLNKEFIAYYKIKEDVIVGIEFSFFSDFQSKLTQLTFKNIQAEELREIESKRGGTGLVPIIEFPIQFPAPVAGIIGQGGKLDISGSQRIEFGGSKMQNLDYKETEYSHESWFPQLEMEQHLGVNLKGTIGEKVHVFIDHDSEREFSLDNTIRLEYEGNEDEIVQSIKAGNTELSLPGIALIGGPTPHKGLFGIKSEAKVGPVNITAVASREETENQTKKMTGGGTTEREVTIEDYDFTKARFFVIVPPSYIHSLDDPYDITSGDPSLLPKEIIDFNVYQGGYNIAGYQEAKTGTAFDIPIAEYQDPSYEDSTQEYLFIKEENIENDFYFLNTIGIDSTKKFTILELNYSLSNTNILAIRWSYKDWEDNIYTVGDTLTINDTLTIQKIQTIKRERTGGSEDTSYVSWWYEFKNIYSLGATDVEIEDIKVFKHTEGEGEDLEIEPVSKKQYAQLLGLKDTDGNIGNIFDMQRGLIFFPNSFPFIDSLLPDPDSIYHLPRWEPNLNPKYYIWLNYIGTTREYSLGMWDIVEGSEVVKINGIKQTKGEDYTINYATGELTFLTSLADDPNADIAIDFQYVPFFQPAAKNLLAMRGETKIGERGQLSSAFIYHSTGTLDERPRLGSEPKKILLGEVVGSWSVQPDFLTTAVDRLPLIDTQSPSSFTISGNAAFSLPDPNTKNEIYLDDMEGVKSSTTLGLNRGEWSFGSMPQEMNEDNFAQVLWYNPRDGVLAYELYPDLPEHKRTEKKQVLGLKFKDDAWRYVDDLPPYWTSLLTCISTAGMDFSESEYLEVWVKGGTGKLHIDIGTDIPEDGMRRGIDGELKGRGSLQTEDKNNNNTLDKGENEDTGLDGVEGEDGKNVAGDEGNDDYDYDTDDPDNYSKINGTEDNDRLDTEDLDRNRILNTRENYFSGEIDLEAGDTDPHFVLKNNAWSLFRIPIDTIGFKKKNSAQWECIKYARLWVEGISVGSEILIAALDIVGNHWKNQGSEKVKLTVKNTDENTDYRNNPPPIEREKDAYGREEREQSLVLEYDALLNEEGGGYTTYSVARNFMQYTKLSFWVRGNQISGPAQFFIRLGSNTSNYYEYRTEPSFSWQEITINLENLAQGKLKRESGSPLGGDTIYIGENYRIVGKPSLTNIMRIDLGIVNDSLYEAQGEVWVDELRLVSPRREPGVATNMTISSKFADLGNFTLSYGMRNPYFKSLGDFMSSSAPATSSQSNISFNSGLSLNKFLPADWKINLPLNVGIRSSSSVPKYQTGSDVILTKEESEKQTSRSGGRNLGISFSKSGSKNLLPRLLLDNIKTLSFSYRDNYSSSWTRIDSSYSLRSSLSYGYSPNLPSIKLGKMEFRYYPQSIDASISHAFAKDREYQIIGKDSIIVDTTRIPIPFNVDPHNPYIILDTSYIYKMDTTYINKPPTEGLSYGWGTSYKPINPLKLSYSTSFTNDLAIRKRKDKETGMSEQAGINFTPSLFGYLSPSVNYMANYRESHGLELDSLRDVSASNTLSFGLPVDISKFAKLLTSIRDESKDSTSVGFSPHYVLMKVAEFTNKLHKPRLSHSISRANQFYSLLKRPDFDYRVGIRDKPGTGQISDDRVSLNSAQITRNYGIQDVGISFGNVIISSSMRFATNESDRIGSKSVSQQISYPGLLVSLSGLERLMEQFTSLSAGINYSMDHNKSGQKEADSINFTSFRKNITFGGNLQGRFKNGVFARFSTEFSTGRDETKGETGTISETQNANYNLSASHSFTPPKGIRLPFMSDTKITNKIDGTLAVGFSTGKTKNLTADIKSRDSKSLNITPQISYNFSSSITGGANATYSQQWNAIGGGGNTRNVGMKFFVEFMF